MLILLHYFTRRVFLLAVLCILFTTPAHTQDSTGMPIKENRRVPELLGDLHDGVLIIRIPTYNAQIDYLKKRVRNNNSGDLYFKEKLREYREKAHQIKEDCIEGFINHYDFSDVYFIPDTAMPAFLSTYDKEYLLETAGTELKEFKKEHIFFCIKGNTSLYSNGHKPAWMIMNYRQEPVTDRFPYYVGVRNVWQSIFSIFASFTDDSFKRPMSKIAEKFDKRFRKRYEQ